MSVQILQNLSDSINYFSETQIIRTLILVNFTDKIIIKTTVWENKFETTLIFVLSKLALLAIFNA